MRVSRELFGNQDRLLVAAAVAAADPSDLYGQALARTTGLIQQRIGPQLVALVEAGLLVKLPQLGGERRVFYERRRSVFWGLAQELLAELVPSAAPSAAPR